MPENQNPPTPPKKYVVRGEDIDALFALVTEGTFPRPFGQIASLLARVQQHAVEYVEPTEGDSEAGPDPVPMRPAPAAE